MRPSDFQGRAERSVLATLIEKYLGDEHDSRKLQLLVLQRVRAWALRQRVCVLLRRLMRRIYARAGLDHLVRRYAAEGAGRPAPAHS